MLPLPLHTLSPEMALREIVLEQVPGAIESTVGKPNCDSLTAGSRNRNRGFCNALTNAGL